MVIKHIKDIFEQTFRNYLISWHTLSSYV